MAAVAPYPTLKQFNVSGLNATRDGMGGIWVHISGSTSEADGYDVILPPGGVGRYIKWV